MQRGGKRKCTQGVLSERGCCCCLPANSRCSAVPLPSQALLVLLPRAMLHSQSTWKDRPAPAGCVSRVGAWLSTINFRQAFVIALFNLIRSAPHSTGRDAMHTARRGRQQRCDVMGATEPVTANRHISGADNDATAEQLVACTLSKLMDALACVSCGISSFAVVLSYFGPQLHQPLTLTQREQLPCLNGPPRTACRVQWPSLLRLQTPVTLLLWLLSPLRLPPSQLRSRAPSSAWRRT